MGLNAHNGICLPGLQAAGLQEADLDKLKGSDPRKLALAQFLWKTSVVSQDWLSEKLRMKSAANVSQQLRRLDMAALRAKLPPRLLAHFDDQTGT